MSRRRGRQARTLVRSLAAVLACLGPLAAAAAPPPPAAAAAAPRWVATPLFGGDVLALAQANSAPEVVYAGTRAAGVFRSTDGGQTWEARNSSIPDADLQVWSLAVDPRRADTVYAVPLQSPHGVLRSD